MHRDITLITSQWSRKALLLVYFDYMLLYVVLEIQRKANAPLAHLLRDLPQMVKVFPQC